MPPERDKTQQASSGHERRDGHPSGVECCAEISRRSLPNLGNDEPFWGYSSPNYGAELCSNNLYSSLLDSQIIQQARRESNALKTRRC